MAASWKQAFLVAANKVRPRSPETAVYLVDAARHMEFSARQFACTRAIATANGVVPSAMVKVASDWLADNQ